MFTPCCPSAGPTGGAGFAAPAGTWSLTSAVILFGDCFNNELIKNRFLQTIGSDKLLTFNNNELFNVLSDYPNIDIARYSDEAKRLKALAEAEFEKRKKEKADILKGQLEAEEIAKREEEKKKKDKDEQNKT